MAANVLEGRIWNRRCTVEDKAYKTRDLLKAIFYTTKLIFLYHSALGLTIQLCDALDAVRYEYHLVASLLPRGVECHQWNCHRVNRRSYTEAHGQGLKH